MNYSYGNAAELLKAGQVGLLPSDTIYGLSGLALNKLGVEKIYKLKGRGYKKPMIVLLADSAQAGQLGLDSRDLALASAIWPAPLTLIVPAGKNTPAFLHRGTKSLAIRVPDNSALRKLISSTGPLVSTSANPEGKEPAQNVAQAKSYFGDKLNFYIDAGELKTQPSTIVQTKNGKLIVLRQGAHQLQSSNT